MVIKTNYERKEERIQKPNIVVWHKTLGPFFSDSSLRPYCLNLRGHTNLVVSSTCLLYVLQSEIVSIFAQVVFRLRHPQSQDCLSQES